MFGQTAEQIKQAKEVIQRSGLSEKQVKEAAKAQGYTDIQIEAAIQKEKALKIETSQSETNSFEKIDTPDIGKSNEVMQGQSVLDEVDLKSNEEVPIFAEDDLDIVDESQLVLNSKIEPSQSELTYFGYDIFVRDPALFQATSVGVVDPDYLIAPGDEIIVMLWGETQFRQVLTVDREGFVFIPEIGQVFVNGLDLNLLESKLFKVFSQSYASLNPQGRTPTTFLDVSLGNLRPLRIQVLGEVAQPGAYTVSPSATLFSSLYYFNGPTTLGSLRDIQLIRGGKKIASIDFYDYLLTGKKPKDQKLQLDDVIFIPRRLKTVAIEGEINRSGIYELKPKESLINLITIAGDLKITAYLDRAQIDRIVPFENREKLGMDRMYKDVNLKQVLNNEEDFHLQDSDHIQIFSVLESRQNAVTLSGAVTRPGSYDLGKSLKMSELIDKADGLLGDAYLERADVVRIKPDFTESLIKLDLGRVLEGDSDHDITLQGMDRVRVYGMTEMVPKSYVSIIGHVKQPGRFLLQENMTLYDLIFKAGGYLDEEFKKLTYLDRAELVRMWSNSDDKEIITFNLGQVLDKEGMANTVLYADDQVRIYSTTEIEGGTRFVSISGYVKRPGVYELYEKNMRIQDLLFIAGGFDDLLYKSKTFLDRADLVRFDNDRVTQSIIPFNLDSVLSNKNHKHNILLLPGDNITIYSETVFNTVKNVTISGVVRNPGTYNLKTNMTLKDLILESGGLNDNVYSYRVEVARIDPLNKSLDNYAQITTFNMDEKFTVSSESSDSDYKNEIANGIFFLKPYDLVSIRPNPYFSNQKQITITGEVLYPGQYTIISSNEKITDIINRAGGLMPNAYPEASQYFRKGVKINSALDIILKNPKSKLNFNVQNGDEILIVHHPNIVNINGEVNTSGVHKYVPGKRLRYYLNLAGGLKPDADKRNIWVEYPNGDSKKYKHRIFFGPKIIDGSTIIVGTKAEQDPFDRTEFAKELSAILANLAQSVAVILLAAQR